MSGESIDVDATNAKGGGQGTLPPLRTRTSRGSPAQVDPSILALKDGASANTWVRKVPPVIGMRERGTDAQGTSTEDMEMEKSDPQRSTSPLDAQGARSRTISANSSNRALQPPTNDLIEGETSPGSPKGANWAPSVRLGTHGHKEARKLTVLVPSDDNPQAPSASKTPTSTAPTQPPKSAPSPSVESTPSNAPTLPKITPNLSMPLLSTLFEQTHALLDRKEEDWAIANYDQLRHVISQLFNSVPLIREMLKLVKRIAPIFIERRQEREATNRYVEILLQDPHFLYFYLFLPNAGFFFQYLLGFIFPISLHFPIHFVSIPSIFLWILTPVICVLSSCRLLHSLLISISSSSSLQL